MEPGSERLSLLVLLLFSSFVTSSCLFLGRVSVLQLRVTYLESCIKL